MANARLAAGDLDRRITIERAITTTDPLGGEVRSWIPVATVWAQVLPDTAEERFRAQEVSASKRTVFNIRWGVAVTVTDRLDYEGRTFEISEVTEIGRRVGQKIRAAARAD